MSAPQAAFPFGTSDDIKQTVELLKEQLTRLSVKVSELEQSLLVEHHVAPAKVYEPMLRVADGSDWDPGSGAGLYLYLGASWTKL